MKGPKNKVPHVPRAFVDMIGAHFSNDFVSVAKNLGIGLRKAYHLAQIDRSFHALGIAPDRLRRIGWTKLSHLAPHIDADNAKELLTLAEAVALTPGFCSKRSVSTTGKSASAARKPH